jgi:hypothetical protein
VCVVDQSARRLPFIPLFLFVSHSSTEKKHPILSHHFLHNKSIHLLL